MRVLNLEDDVTKHNNICKVLKRYGFIRIDWAKNLEDGMELIKNSMDCSDPYALFVTDMYYPLVRGGKEEKAGELFIASIKELNIDTPIIVCSSVRYRIPDILGTVYYSEKIDWENELRGLIKKIALAIPKHKCYTNYS
ncbi:MAG: response regulator [bacterium]|nr:response regulator [bacterium]MDY4100003.1 response regulator [Lachnospiraceae bacterium]